MAKRKKVTTSLVERNIALTNAMLRYLMDHPHLFDSLPDQFELVILPDDDPEIRLYNLELLDTYGSAGKPVVFARLQSRQKFESPQFKPSLFAPVAI